MINVLKLSGVLALFFAAFAPASNSSADMISLQLTSYTVGRNVSVKIGGSNVSTFAGQLNVNLSAVPVGSVIPGLPDGPYIVFCTELAEHIGFAAKQYSVVTLEEVPTNPEPMTQVQADAVRKLYNYANSAQFGGDKDFAAAFQIAVWEITNDYGTAGFGLNVGDFRLNSAPTAVNVFLAEIFSGFESASSVNDSVIGLSRDGSQDQIVVFDPNGHIVPEPTTSALWAIGFTCVVGGTFRRRR